MITAAQADFLLEEINAKIETIPLGDYPPGAKQAMLYPGDVEKIILENAERDCIITKGQAQHLLDAIETNFKWAADKGCTVNHPRLFIEIVIRKMGRLEGDPLA